jgi:hypothetical protein
MARENERKLYVNWYAVYFEVMNDRMSATLFVVVPLW